MNEIDRLRAAHAAIPNPDLHTIEAARARLHAANGSASHAAPASRKRRRDAMLVLAVAVAAIGVTLAAWPANRPVGAGTSVAFAAEACAVPGPAAPCTAALGELAGAEEAFAAGKVFYRRNLFTERIAYIGSDGRPHARRDLNGFAVTGARPEELWLAADRSGRLSYGANEPPFLPSRRDHERWDAAGRPALGTLLPPGDSGSLGDPRNFTGQDSGDILLGAGELNDALPTNGDPLRELSTRPATLARQIRQLAWFQRVRISGDGPCAEDLHDCPAAVLRNVDDLYGTDITTLLRYPLAKPELRRALLTIMGEIPGTRRLGTLTDPRGRRGAAIRLPAGVNDGRNVVVFDLSTGRLLANGMSDDASTTSLRFANLYDIETGAVDRIGQRP